MNDYPEGTSGVSRAVERWENEGGRVERIYLAPSRAVSISRTSAFSSTQSMRRLICFIGNASGGCLWPGVSNQPRYLTRVAGSSSPGPTIHAALLSLTVALPPPKPVFAARAG
jgi:hypothetical protein